MKEKQNTWVSKDGFSKIDESICHYYVYRDSRRDDSDMEPTITKEDGLSSIEFHTDIRTAIALEADRKKLPYNDSALVVSHREYSNNSGPFALRDVSTRRRFLINETRIDVDHYHEGNDWPTNDCKPIYEQPTVLQKRYLVRYPNIDYQGSERVCRVCPRVATISLTTKSGGDYIHISADEDGYCNPVSSLDGQECGGPPCLYPEYQRSIKK